MKKFTSAVSTFILLGLVATQTVFAQSTPLCPPGGAFSSLCTLDISKTGGLVGVILTVLIIIAVLVCLFFLILGGIRYIASGGDKGKIDSARSTLVAALIGLIIALLAFAIVNFVLIFFSGHGLNNLQIPKLYGN
jgi:uncharacterized membrane protein